MDATAGMITIGELSKLINRKPNAEENTSSSTILNPKPFVWDSIIFSLASTIFGLSVSGIIVEFFKSDQNSVTCFTELENRAQYTFINNYCYKFLRTAEYFPVILVLHAAALLIPHFLWKIIFSAQFDSFFSHAAKVETLRDIKTGEYPHKNYTIVDYLQKEFDDRKAILKTYILKLISQLLLMLISVAVNVTVFNDINFNITFDCNDDNERSQLFGNVTCAYPRKIFINVLQVADHILLAVAIIVLLFGLFWCLFYNHCTQDKIADFCYQSCIDAKYYKPPGNKLGCRQMKNDLSFLLAVLSATNTGLGGIFKKILVENVICKKFSDAKNTFIKNDPIRHNLNLKVDFLDDIKENRDLSTDTVIINGLHRQQSQEEQQRRRRPNDNNIQNQDHIVAILDECEAGNQMDENKKPLVDPGKKKIQEKVKQTEEKSFKKVIIEICNGIREEQKILGGEEEFEEFTTSAMDLACGYHSYLFSIARWQLQTISILLGPQSKDQNELFMCENHDCINIMKMPINLLDSHSDDFLKKIEDYLGDESEENHSKLSLVVVGPLDDGNKVTTVNKIIEMLSVGYKFFKEDCVMLIIQPVEIEGENVSESFIEWKPEIIEWHEGDLEQYIKSSSWLKSNKDAVSISKPGEGCGEITALCGKLNCKFKIKIFYYVYGREVNYCTET